MNRFRAYYLLSLVVAVVGVALIASALAAGGPDGTDLLVGAAIAISGAGAAVGFRDRAVEADAAADADPTV